MSVISNTSARVHAIPGAYFTPLRSFHHVLILLALRLKITKDNKASSLTRAEFGRNLRFAS